GSGDKDYKAQLTSVRSLAPDVIFVPGYYAEVALIARQARELGITVPLIGCDAWDSSALVEVAGAAVDGCYYSNHVSYSDTAQTVQTFVAAYRKRFNMAPEVNSALGYDAGKIMAEAIRVSGTAKPADIRAALAATKNFPGITGSITIDERRNAQKPAVVLRIEKGVLVPVASIMP
ncbi:MAG: ABC transporter substrate-binding protein, partial [Rhizobacter sp.]|nr:ABC transporter substrate-binding protein [Chlorobiales bacterium]